MSNININVANKISLAEAARLTGYHQDYLGQLCRGGKLKATKYGRNWFTTTEAIEEFRQALLSLFEEPATTQSPVSAVSQSQYDSLQESFRTPAPVATSRAYRESANTKPAPAIHETVIVSQVEGLPVQIKTLPSVPRGANTVQQLITNIKIQTLQNSVGDIRQTLEQVLSELSRHSAILESKPWLREGLLRAGYSSAFEFHQPVVNATVPVRNIREEKTTNHTLGDWVLTAVVTGCVAFVVYSGLTLQLFGNNPAVTTIDYTQSNISGSERTGAVSGAMVVPVDTSDQTPVTQAKIEHLELSKEYLGEQSVPEMIGGAALGNIIQN